jgi:hypothetical protein
VQLDSQAGVLFGERHELRAFQVTTHLPCTSWRLKITRTLHPPSANSVQLACLNLYAAPNAQIPAETQSAGALQQSSGDWGATAAAVRSQLGSSEYEVLRKLHANIADLPGEQKFRWGQVGQPKLKSRVQRQILAVAYLVGPYLFQAAEMFCLDLSDA